MNFMSPKEIEEILSRAVKHGQRKPWRIKDVDKARIILLYPQFEENYPFEELSDNVQIALLFRDFKRFEDRVDVNTLSRKQVRLFLEANSPGVNKLAIKKLANEMTVERMQEIFTVDMWEEFISHYPQRTTYIDITRIRNQTHLRNLILAKPHVLRHCTIDDMRNSVIPGHTWIRIVSKLPEDKRKHVPVGFAEWVKKDVFKSSLKGKRFKDFGNEWLTGLKSD